jgi:hypothetical protein
VLLEEIVVEALLNVNVAVAFEQLLNTVTPSDTIDDASDVILASGD